MHITARLAASQEAQEKESAQDKDIKMSGVEYAAIEPGDLSPGTMNMPSATADAGSAAATNSQEEAKGAAGSVGDRRAQVMQ